MRLDLRLVFGAALWLAAPALGAAPAPGYDPTRAVAGGLTPRPGEVCLACGRPVGTSDRLVIYRGRRVPLHEGACVREWEVRSETLFAALQPRGALFQEPDETASPLRDAWFGLGAYVVLGLVLGAICAYVAVGRGLAPIPWFFAGFLANFVSLFVLLTRPPGDVSKLLGGVPAGLAKVPTTRPPARCPRCGAENHPAARRCTACGGALTPAAEPEMDRV